MEAITPEDAVVGHVQVQSHGVLLRGHHLAVVPLHQVDAPDLVTVGEQQVGALTCNSQSGTTVSAPLRRLLQPVCGLSLAGYNLQVRGNLKKGGAGVRRVRGLKLDRWIVSKRNKL